MACVLETVTVHSAFTLPAVAVITAEPSFTAVTVPSSATVAISLSLDVHVTASVALAGVRVADNLKDPPGSSALVVVSSATSVAETEAFSTFISEATASASVVSAIEETSKVIVCGLPHFLPAVTFLV